MSGAPHDPERKARSPRRDATQSARTAEGVPGGQEKKEEKGGGRSRIRGGRGGRIRGGGEEDGRGGDGDGESEQESECEGGRERNGRRESRVARGRFLGISRIWKGLTGDYCWREESRRSGGGGWRGERRDGSGGRGGIYGRGPRAEKHVVDTALDFFYACCFGFFFSFLLGLGGVARLGAT
jgi:hypothetical protein